MNLRDHGRDPAGDICSHPSEVEAFLKLGVALHAEERYEEAVAVYRHAVGLKPDFGVAYHNMGNSLMELGRWEEAIASYRNGIRLIPSFPEGYVTIATALQALHKPYEAMASCYRALAMDPACAEAHWNLALALLQAGEFTEGWKEFEWRWQKRGFTSKARDFVQPLWDGSPLQDRTILIHSEQGFGDTFQFVRYIPLVAELCGAVVLECPPAQKTLLAGVSGVSEVVARGEKLPSFDAHLPIMSLPLAFNTRMDNIPREMPYIFPRVDSIAAWADKFAGTREFRVGLVWAGRKKPDPNRTCPLHMFSPLAGIPGAKFYSLQMRNEMSSSDGKPGKLELVDYTASIRDFSDTAALIAHLDLVISIDTGVAHLAGAMGKETWVLLPYAADWRWMLDRDDSPWYPSMRLFRQERPGDWEGAISRINQCLQERIVKGHPERRQKDLLLEQAYSEGLERLRGGNHEAAGQSFLKAFLINPRIPEVFNALGLVARHEHSLKDALRLFRHAVAVDPSYIDGFINHGNALFDADRPEDSIAEFQRALRIAPDDARLYQNLGVAFKALGNFAGAEAAFQKALDLSPGYATARWNFAMLKLITGELKEGFEDFEARFTKNDPVPALHSGTPLWNGAPFNEKVLLIHAEQGFGDTFQFARYLPLANERGGRVVFECQHESLRELLAVSFPGVRIIVRGEAVPPCQIQAPLLSLPRIFGTTRASIPTTVPYLIPPSGKTALWKKRLEPDQGLRIGLVWAGRKKPDPKRSASLHALSPLASVPGAVFYSLQVGEGSEQLQFPPDGMMIHDYCSEFKDFAETAAFMANLDLVITIDSAAAHLSGALGKPVWVLLPHAPDWRWMTGRPDCPWYPAMRLFRQEKPGDWSGPVAAMMELLRAVTAANGVCS